MITINNFGNNLDVEDITALKYALSIYTGYSIIIKDKRTSNEKLYFVNIDASNNISYTFEDKQFDFSDLG